MAVETTSYGSVQKVIDLRGRYTRAGEFNELSIPTLTAVEGWLNDLSQVVNAMLATLGFAVPVTDAEVKAVLGHIVVHFVVDLCDVANEAGRFYVQKNPPGNPMAVILNELSAWLIENAPGLEAMGATRSESQATAGMGFRKYDESGDQARPLFTREGYGELYREWDT